MMLRSASILRTSISANSTRAIRGIRSVRSGDITRQARIPSRGFATTVDGIQKEPADLINVTRLPNGLRVASEALPGSFSGVGVYIDAGSRYEDESLQGVSHIMDRLAFKSTANRTADSMVEQVEALGGNVQCASSREAMMYQAATFNTSVPTALGLLAETVRDPKITDEEVAAQLETAEYELQEIWAKPEMILPELVHTAAFKDNTLGNPLLCPKERLGCIDRQTVLAYRSLFYRPERIVVAFAGIEHGEAVQMAEKLFGDMAASESPISSRSSLDSNASSASFSSSSSLPSSPASSASSNPPSRFLSKVPFFKNLSTSAPSNASLVDDTTSILTNGNPLTRSAHYTGGILTLPPQPPPSNPNYPAFTQIHLAFEGLPIVSDDIYALATLQFILGGGGSFSAGGPGKGMYSRLYTNVLNQHAWVESCVAFNHTYTDSGLFGISASCVPGRVSHMLDTMCRELRNLTLEPGHPAALSDGEVTRAKNQLRSSLLMNLESRMVELEDLGRQVQIHGHRVPVTHMCEQIAKLTPEDLRRVARTVLGGLVTNPGRGSGAPTVVLQEGTTYGGMVGPGMEWGLIQDVIRGWGLGRL